MTDTWLLNLYDDTRTSAQKLQQRYGGSELPERLERRLETILDATTPTEARQMADRVVQGALIHYIYEWHEGRIPGPYGDRKCAQLASQALQRAKEAAIAGDEEGAKALHAQAQHLQAMAEGREEIDPELLQRKRRSTKSRLNDDLTQQVHQYIANHGPVSRQEVLQNVEGLTPDKWTKISRVLKQKRTILQTGNKRGARYSAYEPPKRGE